MQPYDKLDKGRRIRERLPDSLESCMPNSSMRSGLDRYSSSGDLGRHSDLLAAEPGQERERFSDPSGVKLSHQVCIPAPLAHILICILFDHITLPTYSIYLSIILSVSDHLTCLILDQALFFPNLSYLH